MRLLILFLCACLVAALNAAANLQHSRLNPTVTKDNLIKKLTSTRPATDFTSNVQALINRVLLRGGVKFVFSPILEIIDHAVVDGKTMDVFEIDSNDNQIVFRGSSGVALASAFGHYLRYYLKCDLHWEHGGGISFDTFPSSLEQLPLPKENERVVFLSQWRYYQNTCTASYSFAWKDWSQWEYEIDWAAINGFNLPLAFTGQEIVWQQLWKQYGVSDEGLQQYFSGPAFLAWQRMANIRAFAGPLTQNWINKQADLQKQILGRYAELGLTPVLPAFNGVVPEEMQALFPTANITRLGSWNNFPDEYSYNFILSSTDPLFQQVGKDFLNLQFELFGENAKSHIYNCDTFNENKPASSDYDYLYGSSNAVYSSMIAADPQATWLMQGWLFYNDPFWTDENIASYLAGVPDDGMIVLDLTSDEHPLWQKIAKNGKQFIWCMLHNYGGMRILYGNLTLLATDPIAVEEAASDYFLGTGLTMEAIDQNPIAYALMSEMAFHRSAPNVAQWVDDYVTRRYGLDRPEIDTNNKEAALAAWADLVKTVYSGETPFNDNPWSRRTFITLRPDWSMTQALSLESTPLPDVWMILSSIKGLTDENNAYTYDLVDLGRQVMTNMFYDYYQIAVAAYDRRDVPNFSTISKHMLELIEDWDTLLSSHPSYLLGRWIADAKRWAVTEEEANLMNYNARNQVTLWGDVGEIDDYAAKAWAGLGSGYYKKRWELFLSTAQQSLRDNTPLDMNAYYAKELSIGQQFCADNKTTFPATASGESVIALSKILQKKYGNTYSPPHTYIAAKNMDIDGYASNINLLPNPTWTKNIRQLERLCDLDANCIGFTSDGWLKKMDGPRIAKEGVVLFIKGNCRAEDQMPAYIDVFVRTCMGLAQLAIAAVRLRTVWSQRLSLWALGGQYTRWTDVLHAGFWQTVVSLFFNGIGYTCFAACMTEMASTLPFSGGIYGFVRAFLGPYSGYIVSRFEIIMIICYVSPFVQLIGTFPTTAGLSGKEFEPLWWCLLFSTSVMIALLGCDYKEYLLAAPPGFAA